jgi:hypothetical protein
MSRTHGVLCSPLHPKALVVHCVWVHCSTRMQVCMPYLTSQCQSPCYRTSPASSSWHDTDRSITGVFMLSPLTLDGI